MDARKKQRVMLAGPSLFLRICHQSQHHKKISCYFARKFQVFAAAWERKRAPVAIQIGVLNPGLTQELHF